MESLRAAFEAVPEYRAWHKYNLPGLLTMVSLAMLCGCDSVREIARWGKNHRWEFAERLGFANHRMPSLGTIQRVVWQVEAEGFARVVGAWGQTALAAYGQHDWQGLAIDGKTVHGSGTDELPAVHLLSALSQELKVVLGQVEVDKKTNEIKAILPLLADLVLTGQVVTVDALLTQREIAQHILEKKGTT
jgi:hypothetical protein